MPTRSGREYLLGPTSNRHFSIPRIDHIMSDLGSGAFNDGPRMVLVVYAVGKTQYTKLLLEDIYDADKQFLKHNAHDLIIVPMSLLTNHMMNGKNYAKYAALGEAIKRWDADTYLRGSDGIDMAVGRTQSELEAPVKQFTITTLSNALLQIVVKIDRFKAKRSGSVSSHTEDSEFGNSDKDEAVKFTGRYNATQCVRTCTMITNAAVKKKPMIKKEKEGAEDEKGEAYSMEDHLNSKEFHMIVSIKLASRE
jgi:hypothetical protein